MKSQRKRHSAEFKTEVALEAVKGIKTINELASKFEIHPNQVSQWKGELLNNAKEVFSRKPSKASKDEEKLKSRLYQEIGQLKVELDWLKKKTFRSPLKRSGNG